MEKQRATRTPADPFLGKLRDAHRTGLQRAKEAADKERRAVEAAVPPLPIMSVYDSAELVQALEAFVLDQTERTPNMRFPSFSFCEAHRVDERVRFSDTKPLSQAVWWWKALAWQSRCKTYPFGAADRLTEFMIEATERVCEAWASAHPNVPLRCKWKEGIFQFELPKHRGQ